MGVHIIPYKYNGTEDDVLHGEYDDTVSLKGEFDSIRMSGDNDFINENDWRRIGIEGNLRQPIDIDKTIEWCKNSTYQQRFIPYLEKMKTDDSLTFRFAY